MKLTKQDIQSLSERVRIGTEPEDPFKLVLIVSTLLGLGSILAFNVLATAADYWTSEYPEYPTIMFWLIFIYSIPNVLITCVMIQFGSQMSFSFRILFCFITTAILLAFIPFIVTVIDSKQTSFYVTMCIAAYVGLSNSTLQATTIGFTNMLPTKYTQFNIAGQSLAGILASLIRILTKLFYNDTSNGYITSGQWYFIFGSIGDVICAIGFIYIINSIFVTFHLNKPNNSENTYAAYVPIKDNCNSRACTNVSSDLSRQVLVSSDDLQERKCICNEKTMLRNEKHSNSNDYESDCKCHSSDKTSEIASNNSNLTYITGSELIGYGSCVKRTDENAPIRYKNVWTKVKWPAIAVHLTFLITFCVFPGIVASINSEYDELNDESWMPVILITEYNVFDWFGRQFVATKFNCWFKSTTLWIGALIRVFFIYPVFIAMYEKYIVNDIIAHISVIFLGLTNGYFCSMSFTFASKSVKISEMEASGSIMSLALVTGVFLGSTIATGVTYVL